MVQLVDTRKKNFFSLDYYKMKSYRELFYTLYSDEPSDSPADIDFRRINNKYKLQKFEINDRNGFAFFKTKNPMDLKDDTSFLISTPINDEVLDISFSGNEKLIKSIMASLRANP